MLYIQQHDLYGLKVDAPVPTGAEIKGMFKLQQPHPRQDRGLGREQFLVPSSLNQLL